MAPRRGAIFSAFLCFLGLLRLRPKHPPTYACFGHICFGNVFCVFGFGFAGSADVLCQTISQNLERKSTLAYVPVHSHDICNSLFVLCPISFALCAIKFILCTMQFVFSVPYQVCIVHYQICFVHYQICLVPCQF